MNKHFAYLTQSDESDFLQKVASEQAESRMPSASSSLTKTAMQNLLEGVTFEKVAARLDRDIHILKTAGESGMNLGMQKRAGAYIDQLVEQCEMTPEELDQIFEKVAGEAIMGDLVAAKNHLGEGLDPESLAWLDSELVKVGAEMTELAMMEKEAILGALLAGGRAALGFGARAAGRTAARAAGAVGRGVTAPIRAVAGAAAKVPSAIRGMRIARGTKALAKTEAALAKRQGAIAALKTQGKAGGMREAFHEGAAKSLAGKADNIRGKLTGLNKKQLAADADKLKGFGITPKSTAGSAPKASPTVTSPSSAGAKTPTSPTKGEAGSSSAVEAATKATKKNTVPDVPKSSVVVPKPKDESPLAGPMAASAIPDSGAKSIAKGTDAPPIAKGDITLKGSYEKMRDSGWKSLSGDEKQKLINAGVATVVGGRVLTGQGIVTGTEGII